MFDTYNRYAQRCETECRVILRQESPQLGYKADQYSKENLAGVDSLEEIQRAQLTQTMTDGGDLAVVMINES